MDDFSAIASRGLLATGAAIDGKEVVSAPCPRLRRSRSTFRQ
ncbi:MAG: hypothetical protein N2320_03045 [Candidatus Bipolaricaulota bacterium]|nr:hypothetical protein [Candidatus Bipolaricaulota bacterium]